MAWLDVCTRPRRITAWCQLRSLYCAGEERKAVVAVKGDYLKKKKKKGTRQREGETGRGEKETNEGDGELYGQREIITSSGSLTDPAVARHPALGSQWCHCPSFTCWQRLWGPLWSSPLTRDGCCTKAAQISMAASPASFSSLLHRTWTSSFVPAVSVFLLFLPDQENRRDKHRFDMACEYGEKASICVFVKDLPPIMSCSRIKRGEKDAGPTCESVSSVPCGTPSFLSLVLVATATRWKTSCRNEIQSRCKHIPLMSRQQKSQPQGGENVFLKACFSPPWWRVCPLSPCRRHTCPSLC